MGNLLRAYDEFKKLKAEYIFDSQRFNSYFVTYHSTGLEGSTLTKVDTDLLLERGLIPYRKPANHLLMVDDHYKTLNFVLERAKKKSGSISI